MSLLISIKDLIADNKNQLKAGALPPPSQYYIPTDSLDKTLVFESRFESGNLAMAFKLCDTEYNLIL